MVDETSGKNILKADLRGTINISFFIAVLGIALCFCLDNWETLKVSPNSKGSSLCVFYFFFNSYSFGGVFMAYFSSLLAALPFAARYSHEYRGGLYIYAISRCGKRRYARSKLLAAGLSGGATMFLGGLIFIIVLATYLPIITPSRLKDFQGMPYYNALANGSGLGYFAATLYLSFLSGVLWGCVGMCVSAFLPDPYVAICAPMVLNFIFVEFGRLTGLPPSLRLDLLLRARGSFISDAVTLALLTLLVFSLCWLFYRLFLRRVSLGLEVAER